MEWTFKNFNTDLENLNPDVRKKALEIGQKLMEQGGISEEKALKEAIVRAEEWFYNLGG